MATVRYFIQSKNDNAAIYVRFTISRTESFKRKSREFIHPNNWNSKNAFPKNIISGTPEALNENKTLKKQLSELEIFILDQYRNRSEVEIIDGKWLDIIITAFYSGGRRLEKLDFLVDYLEHYRTDVLPYRRHRGKLIAESTKKKQTTIINKIQEFSKSLNKKLKVSDYDVAISNRFEKFLENQGISKNTIGRYIKYPKTIIGHAKTMDIQVNKNLSEIKGFTTETPRIFLTEDELTKIKNITFFKPELQTARDLLVIAFYTGQRASDLLRMNKKQLIIEDGNMYVNLSQKKTTNPVLIPVHDEVVKILEVRDGNFPNSYSDNIESAKTIFNKHLRTITKQAGIGRLEWGKKYNDETKRYVYGNYPLYEIISSHVGRRSFATHYYTKMPTPIIMAVTGHKTEKEFLKYIGKDFNDLSKQMFDYWKKEKITKAAENPTVKNAI